MVSKLSAKIADHLCDTDVITEEDKDLYSYGFFVILSRVMFFVIALTFGLMLHVVIESVVFFILFCLIRSYAGGVHASSEFKCTVYTTGAMLICILCIKLSKLHNLDYIFLIMLILSSICILAISPLDSLEKPLDRQEKRHYRIVTWIITGLIVVLTFTFYLLGLKSISNSCVVSLLLESVLLITGKIKEHQVNTKTGI